MSWRGRGRGDLKGKIVRDTVYRDEMQKCRGKHDGGVSGGWSIMAGSGNPATELHPRSGNPTNYGVSSWIGQFRNGASSEISADIREGRGDEWATGQGDEKMPVGCAHQRIGQGYDVYDGRV